MNTFSLKSITLLVFGLASISANAVPSILSVSDVQTFISNLGTPTVTTSSPVITQNTNVSPSYNSTSTTTSTLSSVVITAPTETTTGLQANYLTPTITTTFNVDTSNYDDLNLFVTSNGTNQLGSKYIDLRGSLLSSIDTTLSFRLSASGEFTLTTTEFGTTSPQLASFFFGGAALTNVASTTTTDLDELTYDLYNVTYDTTTVNLLAGQAKSFRAVVFAPNDVSVNSFELNAFTSNYNPATTTNVTSVIGDRFFINNSVIPTIPEPETYAMLVAGLGVMGFMARRRKNTQA